MPLATVNVPPSFTPAKRRRYGRRRRGGGVAAGPSVPVLTSAVVNGSLLTLTFDQAVDVDQLDGAAIVVDGGSATNVRWDATGTVSQPSADTVVLGLEYLGPAVTTAFTLDASAANGIRAADGGQPWGGVMGVVLPYTS
ncbi:MAG: hypothetical protein AAGI46_00170 [Planctomycetota bacterium]